MPTQLSYVKHYRDLEVYKRHRALSQEVFVLTKTFPSGEKFALTDQIRRASRSIGAQIAETWGKRLYPKHFVSKLTDADGEQLETQHWRMEASDCGYLSKDDATRLVSQCEEIGRMLGTMIRKADSFASSSYSVREEPPAYLTGPTERE